jgi:hypothetical protein
MRAQMQTLPCDLSEYARVTTGPLSWREDLDEFWDEAFAEVASGPLVRTSDVPRVTLTPEECTMLGLGTREGYVLSLLDGETDVETVCDISVLPPHEALEAISALCARGIVTLDRDAA